MGYKMIKMTINEAYTAFMQEQHFRNNTEKTLEFYRSGIGIFMKWLKDDDIQALTLQNYKNFVIYLNSQPLSSATVNNRARAVKAFYNYLIEENLIDDISRKLRAPKVFRQEVQILNDDEIRRLLSCFGSGLTEERNKCWVVLMLDSGLRKTECLKLKIKDFDIKNRSLLINGKGRKQRYVPLGIKSFSLLKEYIIKYRCFAEPEAPLFVDRFGNACNDNVIKLVFQKLKKRSGISRLHCHLLRHTFATMYLVDGGDLETLRIILGHSDIQITQVYLHMAQNYTLLHRRHISHFDKIMEA